MSPKPTVKTSRLKWVGSIPESWDEKRAKFVFRDVDERSDTGTEELLSVSHITGVTPRSEKNVTMFMAETYEGQKLCQPEDVVINSLWAWMGAVGVSKYRGIVSSAYGVYRRRNTTTIYPPYADYLLRTKGYAGEYLCRSTGIWTSRLLLTPSEFLTIPILLPPFLEQQRIANHLELMARKIDRLMALRRRQMELLREQRAALIQQAVTRGLNLRAPIKDSGLPWIGPIPSHWQLTRAKFVSEIFVPQRNKPQLNETDGYCWVTMNDMTQPIIESASFKVSNEAMAFAGARLLPAGSVIASCVGNFGSASVNAIPVIINQQLQAFIPHRVEANFLRLIVTVSAPYFELIATAATLEYVNQAGFANMPIPLPPWDEQMEILAFVRGETAKLDGLHRGYERQLLLLAEYRASLIHECVTGQRPLPN
jgi:type I restriction enzyme, S subunit